MFRCVAALAVFGSLAGPAGAQSQAYLKSDGTKVASNKKEL